MPVINLTDETFDNEVVSSPVPVLVDFWAQWCAPCRIIGRVLEKIANEYEGKVKIAKIEVDANPVKAREYKIKTIPNIKIFKNGKVVDEIIGAVPKTEITRRLDKLL